LFPSKTTVSDRQLAGEKKEFGRPGTRGGKKMWELLPLGLKNEPSVKGRAKKVHSSRQQGGCRHYHSREQLERKKNSQRLLTRERGKK